MVTTPAIQMKAQEELDHVVGGKRLPTVDDLANLPYIRATMMELLRWMPALPLDLPRSCIYDDEYQGYFIPAGTVLIAVGHSFYYTVRLSC